ncbi:eukaryotic elongation factor 5A hypusine, DNA-binding OB fold-domain-containing protein [Mycena metata]|uniref:Eukaryotic translation initiation factor 5A n=1 Tax=Mycena metata TaxID=1033252 RepID=A0AAD7MDM2_9AGAR|nr:eukaryotic elongation factor 5A hypusine, DNA-binding OB fold-domain-containing protein [Mycena metata]
MCLDKTNLMDPESIVAYDVALARALASVPRKRSFVVSPTVIRLHSYIVIRDRPCKVIDMSTSKTGCRSTKAHFVAIDIFTGKKMETVSCTKRAMEAPVVTAAEYTVINVDESIISLLTDDGESKEDVNLPSGPLGKTMAADFAAGKELRVTVYNALGEEQVMSCVEVIQPRSR